MRRLLTCCVVLAGALLAPAAAQACTPQVIDLGKPQSSLYSEVIAFGPHGEAGGGGFEPTDTQIGRALLWRDGQTVDLGSGEVSDINARGDILVFDPFDATATLIAPSGTRRPLEPLRAGDQVYARRLSDDGDVGGASFAPGTFDTAATPVVWRAGRRPQALPVPDGFTGGYVKGLDEAGDAVGGVERATGETLAAAWDRDGSVRVLTTAYPDAPYDEANVIDAHRDVLGVTESFTSFAAEATLWRDGRRIGLGHLPGAVFGLALGVDRDRDVVGADAGPDGTPHAWVTRLGGELRALPALDDTFGGDSMAHAVELSGGDVTAGGSSRTAAGEIHATIWRCAFALSARGGAARAARVNARPAVSALRRFDHLGALRHPRSARPGRLAFGIGSQDNVDVYDVRPDGSDLRRLTDDPAFEACPDYSPDGRWIAYCSSAGSPPGVTEIYAMDADGHHRRAITQLGGFSTFPDVAPHGHRVAFTYAPTPAAASDIATINADGSRLRLLTPGRSNERFPTNSPDGRRIAYLSDRSGAFEVWVMDARGHHQRQLTSDGIPKDQVPEWSPDGTRIAYITDARGGPGGDLWVMDADGRNQRPLTTGPPDLLGAAWSPAGTEIATLNITTRTVQLLDLATGALRPLAPFGIQFVPAWQSLGRV